VKKKRSWNIFRYNLSTGLEQLKKSTKTSTSWHVRPRVLVEIYGST